MLKLSFHLIAGTMLSAVLISAPPALAQAGFTQFASDSQWTSFSYPSGWSAFPTDREPSRYLENYAIQPAGQDFTARPGQVVFRIFDPMYVVEEAGASMATPPTTLFHKFVAALPGSETAVFSTQTYGGRSFMYASAVGDGFEADYAGFVGVNGYLNVTGMAVPTNEAAQRRALFLQVTASVVAPGPAKTKDQWEQSVANWYAYIGSSNANTRGLVALQCSDATAANTLIELFAGSDMQNSILSLGGLFDFSQLRFQTIQHNATVAAVRVGGNIVDRRTGSAMPFYRYAARMRSSNALIVKMEGGSAKVCGPLRGGNR